MAHESFEDVQTAKLMNELFINIKVDREERPDIDQIYMSALQALGQPGGWPLTMFLTPSGEPFWGGTYFPPEPAYGRPSFKQVIEAVAKTYRGSPEKIANNVQALRQALTENMIGATADQITDETLDEFATRLFPMMDKVNGGLQGAPKFPNCQILEFFLRTSQRRRNDRFNDPPLLALKQMCLGGIHDHVGGGFARYSVDERWFVPHFEKMLYDNAQILETLCIAWSLTKDFRYRSAAESIVSWLQREMIVAKSAYAASRDADSEGVEGKYYCWTTTEIQEVLAEEAPLFITQYDIQAGGNWQEAHSGVRTNIPNRLNAPDLSENIEEKLAPLRAKLLAARLNRVPPQRDDKVLADWNALLIAALARAAYTFERREWYAAAHDCFYYVIESMTQPTGPFLRIGHSYRNGRLVWPGMATDYAYLIRAALALNTCRTILTTTSDNGDHSSYIAIAEKLAASLIHFHAHPETAILSLPANDANDILYRTYNTADDATPNPNSIFIQSLNSLAAITGRPDYAETSRRMIQSITPAALKNPFGHASFLNAIDATLNASQIVLHGPDHRNFAKELLNGADLNCLIFGLDIETAKHSTRAQQTNQGESFVAYVCRGQTCSLPLKSIAEIRAEIAAQWRRTL